MVPPDHAALLTDAGATRRPSGSIFASDSLLPAAIRQRSTTSARRGSLASMGRLHSATPEAIVAKDALMTTITALLSGSDPADARWRIAVRGAVDALDALERPFAHYDRDRFDGPTSRDRLITATRERFPDAWR